MDEEFLNDFVGLKTDSVDGSIPSALKKTSVGEGKPAAQKIGESGAVAARVGSSQRGGSPGVTAATKGDITAADAVASGGLKSLLQGDAAAGVASDDDSSPAHIAALERDRATTSTAKHGSSGKSPNKKSGPPGSVGADTRDDGVVMPSVERRKSWGELFMPGLGKKEQSAAPGPSASPVKTRAPEPIPNRPQSANSSGSGKSTNGDGDEPESPGLSTSAPTIGSFLDDGGTDGGDDDGKGASEPSPETGKKTKKQKEEKTPSPSPSRYLDHGNFSLPPKSGDAVPAAGSAAGPKHKEYKTHSTSRPGSGGARSADRMQRNTSSFILDAEANPTPQSVAPPVFGDLGNIGEKHVLVMVGLPARGKTHMAKRLSQYLRFFHGARTQVFNVGSYRRRMMTKKADAQFFDQHDAQSEALRKSFARAALKDMIDFLFQEDNVSYLEQRGFDSGRVAIYDATNTTMQRREWLREQLDALPLKLLFIESVCTDEEIIERNIWQAKVNNEDYQTDVDKKKAYDDFRARIQKYEEVYQPMEEEHLSFIKLINSGRRVEINNIHGYLLGRIVQFLSNVHATHQTIYLSRHGQSEYNFLGKIGGDSGLSLMGEKYAKRLGEYCDNDLSKDQETGEPRPCRLWTSSLQRTILTARHIKHPKIKLDLNGREWTQFSPRVLRNMDEIYAGVCDGMTYEEIEANYPEEFALRRENKLGYRYPRGESYLDVISRLDPLIQELESYQEPVLIVGHQGVLRLIYAYFTGMDRTDACTASIPLNTVIKLTPLTHTCEETREVLYQPTESDLGVNADGGNDAGGGVSPTVTAAARAASFDNPFAMNTEPPSY
jgi:broad specificity phosphatase PhoE/adenylate kinase family enzyme|tara:strand:- start:1565 stop:4063 length:2499 start_codon:yes stop_codon:yes gene_type:complete